MAETTERIAILLELEKERLERSAKSAGRAITALERKFDPLAAAEAKAQKRTEQFAAALEAGTIDVQEHAKALDLIQRELDQTTQKYTKVRSNVVAMNSSVAAQTGFMTRNRSVFQAAGYQVGDFAVQVQGGTSALTAFTQQGSQLLGVFGPAGAVLGALLAVGAPLAGYFLRSSESAADLSDQLKALKESIQAVQEAESAMQTDFSGSYGALAEEAEAVFEINRKIAGLRATASLDRAARGVAGDIGVAGVFGFSAQDIRGMDSTIADLDARIAELNKPHQMSDSQLAQANREITELTGQRSALLDVKGNFDDLAEALALTDGQALEVAARFAEIGQAQGTQQQAEAMSMLMDYIHGVTDGLSGATEEGEEFYDNLREAVVQALELAKIDIAGNVREAADEAARLAANLRLAEMRFEFSPGGRAMSKYGGRGTTSDQPVSDGHGNILKDGRFVDPDAKRTGGGSKREQRPLFEIAETEIQNLSRQIDLLGKSKSEIAALTVRYKLLDEARKRGIPVTEELSAQIDAEAREVRELAEEYEGAKDSIAAMESVQRQFKDGVIDAAMGGKDAMEQFANSIKRAALEWALFGEGPFAKGGGGGLLGSLVGAIFPKIGANATGTDHWKGGLTSINERGGEIVDLPNGTRIIPHDVSKRVAGQSQGGVLEVRLSPGLEAEWLTKAGMQSAQITGATAKSQQRHLGGSLSGYDERGTT